MNDNAKNMLLHYWTNFEFWTEIWVLHQGVYDNSAWPSSPIASPCHLHQFPFWSWGNIWFDHLGARASCCCGFWHLPPSSGKILCGIYSIQSSWMDLTNSYDKRIDHDSSVSLAINGLSLQQTEEVWWSWSGTFSSFAFMPRHFQWHQQFVTAAAAFLISFFVPFRRHRPSFVLTTGGFCYIICFTQIGEVFIKL